MDRYRLEKRVSGTHIICTYCGTTISTDAKTETVESLVATHYKKARHGQ